MKIDGVNAIDSSQWKRSDGFRSPATARAFERIAADLESSVDPAARDEMSGLLGELKAKIAEVSASDPRPYGRSVEHEIKQMLIHARNAAFPETTASEPVPVPVPAPDPSAPVAVEPPDSLETEPAQATYLDVLR